MRRRKGRTGLIDSYPPMSVVRVVEGRGSHIQPPLDQGWSPLAKLRWQAGVVAADTGVQVNVTPQSCHPEEFGLSYPNGSIAAFTFKEAWVFLNGFETGWRVRASGQHVAEYRWPTHLLASDVPDA